MPKSKTLYRRRQQLLYDTLEAFDLDALLLNAGPSLRYITGLDFHLSERPVVAILRPDGVPSIVLPELEAGKLAALSFDMHVFTYGERPASWEHAFRQAVDEAHLDYRRVGVEPGRFRVLELRYVEEAAPSAAYLDAEVVTATLRSKKDEREVGHVRRAVEIAEQALRQTLARLQPGITERQAASVLTSNLLQHGSEPDLPFSPIIAFGPSTANPHANPSGRRLEEGDLVLVDWGARAHGYASDLTRMFCWGQPSDDTARLVEIVAEANAAARAAIAPGATVASVDAAARNHIKASGFGEQFVHRTGHGLGLDIHEAPYIRADADTILEVGMVFTVEPGIYVSGLGGARIEDDVLVTPDGAETLSTLDRRLTDLSRPDR